MPPLVISNCFPAYLAWNRLMPYDFDKSTGSSTCCRGAHLAMDSIATAAANSVTRGSFYKSADIF